MSLVFYVIINIIFKAVFLIKAARLFATGSYSFNKLAIFEILGILGFSKLQ